MSEDILTLPPPAADARLRYGPGPQQFADLRLPKTRTLPATIVTVHGGFWRAKYDLGHAGHLCAALTAQGVPTVNLEYRRVGNEGGGWPGTLEDIRQAIRYLNQNATFEVGRLLVVGHSAGGQLAIAVAANETDVSAVVSLAGVLDLQRAYELRLSNDAVVEFLGGKPSQVPERYREADPMRLNVPTSTRQIIIHGSDDDVVPVTFSLDYVEKKKRAGENVRLLEIRNANHFDVIDPRSKAWGQMIPAILGAMKVPSG